MALDKRLNALEARYRRPLELTARDMTDRELLHTLGLLEEYGHTSNRAAPCAELDTELQRIINSDPPGKRVR